MSQFGLTEPVLKILPIRGNDIAIWEWPGEDPPLLFAHATGFHARCWDAVIRRLPGHRAIAIDLRGHGRSAKPDPPYPWRGFGEDVAEIAALLDLRGAVGIGHSMGGHSIVSSALLRPETYASMFLIDPTIFQPEYYGRRPLDSSFILRRRRYWSSPEEMFESFRNRAQFALWHPEVLHDYCEYGLLPAGAEFELACPPLVEASIYPLSAAPESNLHGEMERCTQPVVVVRAGFPWKRETFDLNASPTDPDLASRFPQGCDVLLTGRSHFIPMESPEWVAEEIERMAATSGRTDPADAAARP
ncbi:Alpha/beta hydrolase fold [Candidatus Sulfopaludibacter sp. SbA3]|nr:Alpha/beta hydrolase fold [Candidatus Sulfopaludibacter sp. SbA3]